MLPQSQVLEPNGVVDTHGEHLFFQPFGLGMPETGLPHQTLPQAADLIFRDLLPLFYL